MQQASSGVRMCGHQGAGTNARDPGRERTLHRAPRLRSLRTAGRARYPRAHPWADGERSVPLTELYRVPSDRPDLENVLAHGDLIAAIEIPLLRSNAGSAYVKVRDRASYEKKALINRAFQEPSDGLEPSTPSLPWNVSGNLSQPTATVSLVWALL